MRYWTRLVWLLLSAAGFIWLQSIPVLQWARSPLLNPPRGLALWGRILADWRHSWLFLLILAGLTAGLCLEALRKRAAVILNVGLYVLYVLWWIPGLIALLRGSMEPEGVAYMVAFGGSALIILTVNAVLYRREWRFAHEA